jgi:hypothetical protein
MGQVHGQLPGPCYGPPGSRSPEYLANRHTSVMGYKKCNLRDCPSMPGDRHKGTGLRGFLGLDMHDTLQ